MADVTFKFVFEDEGRSGGSASSGPAPSAPSPGSAQSGRSASSDSGEGVPGASGRAAAAMRRGGGGAAAEPTVAGGARQLAGELANFPIVGRAAQPALDIFDKLKPLFGEMKATGRASQVAAEVAGPAIPRPSLADKGFEYDPVSRSIRPASLAAQDARANASLPSLAKQGATYDPVSQKIVGPATNAASKALESTANAARTANATGAAARVAGGAAAAGEAAGGVGAASGAAGALAAALGPVAIAAAATGVALKLAVDAAQKFGQAVSKRAEELAGFSPAIARSRARNEVADVRANLRAGRDFGENFSRFNAASGETSRALRRITDIIENKLLDKALPFIELAGKILGKLAEHSGAIEVAVDGITTVVSPMAAAVSIIAKIIERFWGDEKAKELAEDALKSGDFMAFFRAVEDLTLADPDHRGPIVPRKNIGLGAGGRGAVAAGGDFRDPVGAILGGGGF